MHNQYLFVLAALFPIILVTTIPIVKSLKYGENIDIFEPPWFVAAGLLIGTFIRTCFLIFDPSADVKMHQVLGPFKPEDVLPYGLLAINVGIFFWWAGYNSPIKVKLHEQKRRFFSVKSFKSTLIVLGIISIGMLLVYLSRINFFNTLTSYGISGKRYISVNDVDGNTTVFMQYKMGSEFIATIAIVFAAWVFNRPTSSSKQKIVLLTLILLGCLIPFISSSRNTILYLILTILLTFHYQRQRIPIRNILTFMLLGFIMLGFMGNLRKQAYSTASGTTIEKTGTRNATLHTIAYSAHFVGVGKTSVILAQVPEKQNYLYGQSYLSIFYAPIPRSMWHNKPIVRIGRFVGVTLFERNTLSGVPPGLIGESYLNFGWVGIIIIMYVFGIFCRYIYTRLILNRDPSDFFSIALYGILWVFLLDVLVTDFTGNVMRVLRFLIPLALIYSTSVIAENKIYKFRQP